MDKTMELKHERLIHWFTSCVDDSIKSVEEIVHTMYSLVLKIQTRKTVYYLKQTPESFFIEAAVLDLLASKCGVMSAPKKIAENREMSVFVTQACGDETLRTFFKGALDCEMLKKGISCYRDIQCATAPYIDLFLNAGVPDWRIENFLQLYEDILSDSRFIGFLELTTGDLKKLENKQESLASLCQKLKALNIPDTLNHDDFQNNNILIDHASGQLRIIDWGEVYIGNPLLSRYYCITSAKHVYQLDDAGTDYTSLENFIFDSFHSGLHDMRDLIRRLYPIAHTLAWRRLIQGTDYKVHSSRREHVRHVLLGFEASSSNFTQ